jgi:hypothetical protein
MEDLVSLHRYFHGILLKEFLEEYGVEPTPSNIEKAKQSFKRYLNISSLSSLSPRTYSQVISATTMLMAREFGKEIPRSEADKTMRELLNEQT